MKKVMSEIINANEYNVVCQVVKEAVDRSIKSGTIVRIDGYKMRDAIHNDLYEICEGYVYDDHAGHEYWGQSLNADDTLSDWRVHLSARGT